MSRNSVTRFLYSCQFFSIHLSFAEISSHKINIQVWIVAWYLSASDSSEFLYCSIACCSSSSYLKTRKTLKLQVNLRKSRQINRSFKAKSTKLQCTSSRRRYLGLLRSRHSPGHLYKVVASFFCLSLHLRSYILSSRSQRICPSTCILSSRCQRFYPSTGTKFRTIFAGFVVIR